MQSPDSTTEAFKYGNHNEAIFDDSRYFPALKQDTSSVVRFDAVEPSIINSSTLKALVVQLTLPEIIDYNLICDFFLTYRAFTLSAKVLDLLMLRLIWSLQYVNSSLPDTTKIGKLVLVRTFVVLRHWILNYFVDDFQDNEALCDGFVSSLNLIALESQLIKEDMVFEQKVVCDLKTHWISQINQFFNMGIDLNTPDILAYALPALVQMMSQNKMSKLTTDTSIHTNPSFRRSAMLSLYDPKTHHRCLVYDESASKESPLLSVGNLIAQHKSSRLSLNTKLEEFHIKNKKKAGPLRSSAAKVNLPRKTALQLTDSSLGLKKVVKLEDYGEDTENVILAGFSTNGSLKLPSSRVDKVVPSTPVKKMEVVLVADGSPKKRLHTLMPSDNDVLRRKSLKKFVDGWSLTKSDKSKMSDEFTTLDENEVLASTEGRLDILSSRIIDELEYLLRILILDNNTITENEDRDSIRRSAIDFNNDDIVDNSFTGENLLATITVSPRKKKSQLKRSMVAETSIQDISDLNIEKIDNLFSHDDITMPDMESETDYKRPTSQTSFAGRVTSLNWNDEDIVNFENSALLAALLEDESGEIKSNRISTKYFDVSDEPNATSVDRESFVKSSVVKERQGVSEDSENDLEKLELMRDAAQIDKSILDSITVETPELDENELPPSNLSGIVSQSSISVPSDLDMYSQEVADLGIAKSPEALRRRTRSKSFLLELALAQQKRMSMLSKDSCYSHQKRDSTKSYVSYDSAFSVSSGFVRPGDNLNFNLKKKTGHQNLRKFVYKEEFEDDDDVDIEVDVAVDGEFRKISKNSVYSHRLSSHSLSKVSRSSSLRKSVRFSTLYALTELPFNSQNSTGRESSTASSRLHRLSAFADCSLFSKAIENVTQDSKKTATVRSFKSSAVIPEISSFVLKELAAIPDESFKSDPIQFALYKLEGKKNLKSSESFNSVFQVQMNPSRLTNSVAFGESPEVDRTQEGQDTEEIMAEINNAVTEDAIGYSSDIEMELREHPVTPIKRDPRSVLLSASNPHLHTMFSNANSSEKPSPYRWDPKLILENYTLSSEQLSVEKVLANSSHVSFVLSYNSRVLAEHFTMIERDVLQEIEWRELVELKWNKELKPANSWLEIIVNEAYFSNNKGVNLVIARFNLMVNWTISEILLTRAEDERLAVISRFVHIAQHAHEMQNFSTLMQIILALTSAKVTKLKSTWQNLPPGDILTFKNLEELASPFKNFMNIRVHTNQVLPSDGCIPFVGLYLSDLIFNAERPKFAKPDATSPNITGASDSTMVTSDSQVEEDRLINFSRFRTAVHVVKSLSQCIEWSSNYKFSIQEDLLRKCLYVKSLDEEEMNYCVEALGG